jgi:hypothetical protein
MPSSFFGSKQKCEERPEPAAWFAHAVTFRSACSGFCSDPADRRIQPATPRRTTEMALFTWFSELGLDRKVLGGAFLLPWAQEVPGSNPGAPTTNLLNYLRLFLRGISTAIQLGNIWEQLVCEHVHSVSLGTPTDVRINFQSCCHVRMPQLSLCNPERRSLGM